MLGVLFILLATLANASASVLQRRANADEPDEAGFSVRMLFDLAARPSWWGGIACMILGFVFQVVALTVGRIAVVQPLLVVELPLTLLLASLVFGGRLPAREWVAILVLAVGLAAFVWCLSPTGGDVVGAPLVRWLVGLVIVLVVAAVLVGAGLRTHGQPRAALWGVATGAVFGLVAALVAGVGAAFTAEGVGGVVTSWQTWVVVVVGPTSFFLLQNALQAGSLDASQPGFTLVNPLVGVLWGVLVFGEDPRTGPWLVGTVLGAVAIVGATLLLVRSPALGADEGDGGAPAGAPATAAGDAAAGGTRSGPAATSSSRTRGTDARRFRARS